METAIKGRDVFSKILALRRETEKDVLSLGKRAVNARSALDFLFRQPVITAATLQEALNISHGTAHTLVREFARLGILTETTGQSRYRVFSFARYIKLFADRDPPRKK
jgi:Fic family protein